MTETTENSSSFQKLDGLNLSDFTDLDIDQLLREGDPRKIQRILKILKKYNAESHALKARSSFLDFVRAVWPGFICGYHHEIMAKAFDRVLSGELKRLIINMPPRHGKSELTSKYLPAYFIGRFPERKIIQAANIKDLAQDWGRAVKHIIEDDEYRHIFPNVQLAADSKAAGRWNTNHKGEYYAVGVDGKLAGRGAHLLVIDDPHSEQDVRNPTKTDIFDSVYEWYLGGPRQRLQPNAAIIIVMTRWSERDLCGRLLEEADKGGRVDQWEVIKLPAVLPSGKLMWPEFWSESEVLSTKETIGPAKWNAQYQQEPTSEENALVKRDWWQIWEQSVLPECDFVIQSWDTAFLKTERADYSACTTWGVFYRENRRGQRVPNIILLDAYQERLEFPELKEMAFRKMERFTPDVIIVEQRASGSPLTHELRMRGVPVQEYQSTRGNDKVARVNAVTSLFQSGMVWAPPKQWADDVIHQFAAFPFGRYDDLVDSSTQALIRFRQGGFITLPSDEEDDTPKYRTCPAYY